MAGEWIEMGGVRFKIDADGSMATTSLDKLSKQTNTTKSGFERLQAKAVALGQVIGNVITQAFRKLNQFLREGVDEWIKQRKAVVGLEQGLKNIGQYSHEAMRKFTALSTELQKTTGVADDQILQAARVLTTFNLTAEEIQATIPVMLDVNAVIGDVNTDLTSLANQFGKVVAQPEQMASTMSRSGIIINKETLKGMSLDKQRMEVLKQITAQYGGQARAMQEASGGLDRLKAAWGDFKELFGRWVTENLEPAIKKITQLLEDMNVVFQYEETVKGMLENIFTGMSTEEIKKDIEYTNEQINKGYELINKLENQKIEYAGAAQKQFEEKIKGIQEELDKAFRRLEVAQIVLQKREEDANRSQSSMSSSNTDHELDNAKKLLDIWELIKIKVESKVMTQHSAVKNLHDEALAEEVIVSLYTKRQELSQEELDRLKTSLERLEYYKELLQEISEAKTAGGTLGFQEKDIHKVLFDLEAISQIVNEFPALFSKIGEITGMSTESMKTVNTLVSDFGNILNEIVNNNPIGIILSALNLIVDVIQKIKENADDASKAVEQMARTMSALQKALSDVVVEQEAEWNHLGKIGQAVSDEEKKAVYAQLLHANEMINGDLKERWYLEEQIYALQQTIAGTPLTEQEKLERQLKILESEYALLDEQDLDVTGNIAAQIEVLNQLLDLENDVVEQNEIKLKILKLQNNELKSQIDYTKELQNLQAGGLFDEENLYQINKVSEALSIEGYSKLSIGEILSGLGVTERKYNQSIVINGGINTEINEAQGDSLERKTAFLLNKIFGGGQ